MAPVLGTEAQRLCQALLRIDTTNPPGNERPAADYIQQQLEEVGYETTLLESAPTRANLVCRYEGNGSAEPLLLTAHLDVAEADPEQWRYPPFSGEEAEGCLWGRGAIDMKNMAAMSVAVMRKLARDKPELSRDVIFAAVADEEAGCTYGSKWLCEHHPDLVRAEYAIGEIGGFSMHIAGSTFYPIQVAEKGMCWVRATVCGEPGHGSLPRDDSAVIKLSEAIARLGRKQLPAHPTPVVREFLNVIASQQPVYLRPLLKVLTHPRLLPSLLRAFPDKSIARSLRAMMANTASPTVVSAGAEINVIPDKAEVLIDGRTLPGQTDHDLLRELGAVLGPDVELEIMQSAPPVVTEPARSPLFTIMEEEIQRREPGATAVPYLVPGFTDAKYFTTLGAKWYGFSPVKIPAEIGMHFADMVHGHNERVPIEGLHWGAELLSAVVYRFCA